MYPNSNLGDFSMKRKISLTLSSVLVLSLLLIAARTPKAVAQDSTPSCGTDPVVLNAYFETGFDLPFKLSDEFTKQFPSVTWDIKQDQFANLINATPRLLSGDN